MIGADAKIRFGGICTPDLSAVCSRQPLLNLIEVKAFPGAEKPHCAGTVQSGASAGNAGLNAKRPARTAPGVSEFLAVYHMENGYFDVVLRISFSSDQSINPF